ncbi:MAG: C1 family peptidase [Candidatus Marinimicrobia bacterium]|nr:C1 family peptidase [Candidatus Neomarinimicrobiota bacterium]
MKLKLLVIFALALALYANDGAVDARMLQEIRKSFNEDAYTKATQNAITNNSIQDLALNRSKVQHIDKNFSYRIDVPGITDQENTGRCWLFTSLNVLRPKIVARYNLEDFEFSENYLFFWDQFEKANLFLENIIATRDKDINDEYVRFLLRSPIGDGGVWNMMPGIVGKYGFIPKEFMEETRHSANTGEFRRILSEKLRTQAMDLRAMKTDNLKKLQDAKTEMLKDVYRILALTMGTPPEKFTWRIKEKESETFTVRTMTPQEFYQDAIDYDLGQYVMLMDDPSRPYHKFYEIQWYRNLVEGINWKYINLPSDEIKKFAKKSILGDEPMYFSCDVGKHLDRDRGLVDVGLYDYESLFGVQFDMTKEERILSYQSGSSHGMALVGIDTTADGEITKWLLENSWGADAGFKGFLIMTDDWFDEYMFRLVIKEEFLPENILKILQEKPEKLPPWDRMF